MVGWFIYQLPRIYEETKKWLSQLPARVSEWFSSVYNNTQKWWTDIRNKATEKAHEMFTNVVRWITNLYNEISRWLSQLPGRIYGWFTDSKNKAVEVAGNMVDGVWNTIKSLPDKFRDALDAVGEAIKSYGSRLLSWGAGLVDSFVAGIKSKIASIKNAFSAGLSAARAVVETHSPPKEGPMKNIDKWGAGLMKTYADSIAASGVQIKHAINVAISDFAPMFKPNATMPMSTTANKGSVTIVNNITVNGAGKDGYQIGSDIVAAIRQQVSFAL